MYFGLSLYSNFWNQKPVTAVTQETNGIQCMMLFGFTFLQKTLLIQRNNSPYLQI